LLLRGLPYYTTGYRLNSNLSSGLGTYSVLSVY
jgi:hypothetical protein